MIETREAWLTRLTEELRPVFQTAGYPLPEKIRAACGFPSRGALANKKRSIGEAWSCDQSDDAHYETFVSPMLSDPIDVAAVQVHELCHCAAGLACKHKKPFCTIAKAVGLEGKMTATVASDYLREKLAAMVEVIGPYPHAKLVHSSAPKKQKTRMKKITCPECGYTCRAAKKWMDIGLPTCPCGTQMTTAEDADVELE